MTNQKDLLNELYKNNSLTKEDVFDSGQYKIITRSGIEKIQYNNNIEVSFKAIHMDIDLVVVKAKGTMPHYTRIEKDEEHEKSLIESHFKTIETFGEWNITHAKKKKDGNIVPYYSVALAEKRALSRVVLKLMGLYEYGFKGEDEEFYNLQGDEPADPAQTNYIETLLQTCTYDHDWVQAVENNLGNMTKTGASQLIVDLKNNQQDPITEGLNYNQGDIKKKV